MRYLITTNHAEPFFTKWFDPENHWIKGVEMIVYDLNNYSYTKNGTDWIRIEIDNL